MKRKKNEITNQLIKKQNFKNPLGNLEDDIKEVHKNIKHNKT